MGLTEKLQFRLTPEEKATLFRLAAAESLVTGKKISAGSYLRSMFIMTMGEKELEIKRTSKGISRIAATEVSV